MYSFYGGRPGNSFIIITSFPSVQDMITEFKKGPAYSDVHFDEHVIINTNNKNDPDNGKIFRRGYNYTAKDDSGNDTGGAIPIGQIVGPAGPAPTLFLDNYDTVENKKTFDPTINSEKINENTGSYTIDNSSLVPGYEYNENTETEKFNDEIQWTFCSIKTEDDGECIAYIGFKIPYLIIDWEVESTSAYENPTIEQSDDSVGHPFYKKWKLGIPQGKHGTSLSNLRIENNTIMYNQTSYENQEEGQTTSKLLGNYKTIQYITKENGLFSIKYENINEPQTFLIQQIESIQLDSDYKINIKYYNNEIPYQIPLKCITNIAFNENNGSLTFTYANSSTQTETYFINWIKDAEIKTIIEDDKEKQFLYLNWINPTEENSTSKEMRLDDFRWVKNLNLTDDGLLTATYNDGEIQTINKDSPIQWIKYVDVNENGLQFISNINNRTYDISTDNNLKWLIKSISLSNDGILTIQYNAGDPDILSTTPIKWINSIENNENNNGVIDVTYNTGDSDSFNIRQINNLSMNNNGTIMATYNDGETQTINENSPIRWIEEVEIDENNHLKITYSDSQDIDDVGSVAANLTSLTFLDEYANNLNCSGIGKIITITEENQGIEEVKKYINFTSPTTFIIGDRDVQILLPEEDEEDTLEIVAFTKNISNQQISFGDDYYSLISIEKTLTGFSFMIEIPSSDNLDIYENLLNGDIIDILITGLNLHFTEPQQEGDNG